MESLRHVRARVKEGVQDGEAANLLRRDLEAALAARVQGSSLMVHPAAEICEGRMRVIAHIEQPEVVVRILRHLGLPTAAPPTARARPPPEQLDCWDD